jgi:hypothetical protein
VPLEERRNAAWDERFDHIARHFEREKRSIDEWICAEENQPKKILLEEKMKRDFFDDEDEREKEGDVDAAGDDDDAPQPQPQPPVDMPGMSTPKPPVVDVAPGAGQKRPHSEDSTFDDREAKRRQTMTGWRRYCCACQCPCGAVDVVCTNCEHQVCGNCSVEGMEAFNMLDFYCKD